MVVSVLGLGGYIVYDKVLNNSATKNNSANAKEYSFKEIKLNKCFEEYFEYDEKTKTCTIDIKQDNKNYNIKVINEGDDSGTNTKIIINNKKVFSNDSTLLYIKGLYLIDNNLFFNATLAWEYVVPYYVIIRYSIESGKTEMIKVDKELSTMDKADSEIKIVKNKMYFKGTIISDDDYPPEIVAPDKNEYFSICDNQKIKSNNIDIDSIANAFYELEYTGENKFSITRVMELETIQDVIIDQCEDSN